MRQNKRVRTFTNVNIINPELYNTLHGFNIKKDKTPVDKAIYKFLQYCKNLTKY